MKPRDGTTGCITDMIPTIECPLQCFLEEMWGLGTTLQLICGSKAFKGVTYSGRLSVPRRGVETGVAPHFGPWHVAGRGDGIFFLLPLLRFPLDEQPTRTFRKRSVELYKGTWSDARDTKKMPPTLVFSKEGHAACLERAVSRQLPDTYPVGSVPNAECALVTVAHLWCWVQAENSWSDVGRRDLDVPSQSGPPRWLEGLCPSSAYQGQLGLRTTLERLLSSLCLSSLLFHLC